MAGLPKDRPVPTYRCPHCGDQIFRLPGNHESLRCNHCSHRYMVLIDEQTRTAAFVDQAAKPGSEPLWLPKGSIRALVALSLAAAALVVVVQGRNVPAALLSLLLTVVGLTAALVWIFVAGVDESMPPWSVILLCGTVSFYFGSRS